MEAPQRALSGLHRQGQTDRVAQVAGAGSVRERLLQRELIHAFGGFRMSVTRICVRGEIGRGKTNLDVELD